MATLVFVESPDDELSQQALTFAAGLGAEVLAAQIDPAAAYAPAAWADALRRRIAELAPAAVLAPGTDRGNEVMAHLAAALAQPLAANCTSATLGDPAAVVRVRWGGSVLEEARLHGEPKLMTVAPHAVTAAPSTAAVERIMPAIDGRTVRVSERVPAASTGVSLAQAPVVVSGGRGVGSAEGFAVIEELAGLLGGAVGCSRAVTSAGWRPHAEQVGQTGTKVAPDLYIACGISGATQHMAGCKGAKKLLAVNPDADASILAHADYAVIGDLHQVVPAVSAAIRKVRAP